jgi:hypothetical protein
MRQDKSNASLPCYYWLKKQIKPSKTLRVEGILTMNEKSHIRPEVAPGQIKRIIEQLKNGISYFDSMDKIQHRISRE